MRLDERADWVQTRILSRYNMILTTFKGAKVNASILGVFLIILRLQYGPLGSQRRGKASLDVDEIGQSGRLGWTRI